MIFIACTPNKLAIKHLQEIENKKFSIFALCFVINLLQIFVYVMEISYTKHKGSQLVVHVLSNILCKVNTGIR
jgi:hypothetical protein